MLFLGKRGSDVFYSESFFNSFTLFAKANRRRSNLFILFADYCQPNIELPQKMSQVYYNTLFARCFLKTKIKIHCLHKISFIAAYFSELPHLQVITLFFNKKILVIIKREFLYFPSLTQKNKTHIRVLELDTAKLSGFISSHLGFA